MADLGHLCRASGVAVELSAVELPSFPGASFEQVLFGGDDYELCFCAPPGAIGAAGEIDERFLQLGPLTRIGEVVPRRAEGDLVSLDGVALDSGGYDHFAD